MISDDFVKGLTRFEHTQGPRKLGPKEGEYTDLPSVGVRFMIWTEESGGGFSLVEHPIAPRTLAAPLHIHEREDEYSFVLEGRMGALLGDDVVYVEAGELAFKPRNQWHTFWNAGDEPCRILEIIAPGGFEHFFREIGNMEQPSPDEVAALAERYGHYYDWEGTARVVADHGLEFPLPLPEVARA
ncbi:MAG TPA: cupin domain-containing protein [Solirubrobacterales bacterium]|nr:cupin domain-containing protein [Solirubrobacterales bacterium]